MKKSQKELFTGGTVYVAVLCMALTAWPVMAEETEKPSSRIEEARALIEAEGACHGAMLTKQKKGGEQGQTNAIRAAPPRRFHSHPGLRSAPSF